MVIISALVCVYYNMIIAYILLYFFYSLDSVLPWSKCKPQWVLENNCVDHVPSNLSMMISE
jgi:solute carrier family 6 amino acid transporter-like protein 5/7/9/14